MFKTLTQPNLCVLSGGAFYFSFRTDQQLWFLGIFSGSVSRPRLCVSRRPLTRSLRLPGVKEQGVEVNVGGRAIEAGPLMRTVIIVRLKVGHTLRACSTKSRSVLIVQGD